MRKLKYQYSPRNNSARAKTTPFSSLLAETLDTRYKYTEKRVTGVNYTQPMDFQVPTDLIRQLQHSLRNQAGLSSYDPSDPTLPALPSLRGSVSGFDPSPPYLRCKHCQGRLLRGLQSIICVYCGKRQPKDVTPDPIRFKSTLGYKWLLQSLDLDGSVSHFSMHCVICQNYAHSQYLGICVLFTPRSEVRNLS